MELKQILNVMRRRWWLIALPSLVALAVAVIGVLNRPTGPAGFASTVRFTGAAPIDEEATTYEDTALYPWTSSEYVVNALVDWSRTSSFAAEVNQRLEGTPYEVAPGAFIADNVRSVMTLTITRPNPDETAAIMQAAVDAMTEEAAAYFPQVEQLEVVPLDEVGVGPVPAPLTNQLDPVIRFMVGVVAGVGLAFLVEYLDPTLRDRTEVEAMGIPVLTEVPRR
jgi:capsular polysaccharide biosynthesis protein